MVLFDMRFVKRPLGLRQLKHFKANEFYSKKEENFIQGKQSIQILVKDDFNMSYNKLLQDKTNNILNKRL